MSETFSVHERPTTRQGVEALRERVREAAREALSGSVACAGCGVVQPLRIMFRCYFCGLWFCHVCGRVHFGPRPEPCFKEGE